MNHILLKLSAALLAAVAITGCDSADDDATGSQTKIDLAAYVGEWTTGCVPSGRTLPASSIETYIDYHLQLDAATWRYVAAVYLDEGCVHYNL